MSLILALMLAMTSGSNNLIDSAIESFGRIESYQVTLKSASKDSPEEIRYYFKKPGFVRMEFVKPHRGAVLVFNPLSKQVRLRPFDNMSFFVLTLNPDNPLVKSPGGHGVDKSDIGELLNTVKKLQSGRSIQEYANDMVGERRALIMRIEGTGDHTVDGIHVYDLWLDENILLPLKAAAYDIEGALIEEVLMDDLRINVQFPESFFEL